MGLADVPEQMLGLHEVVARVAVAVVLQGYGVATVLGEDTHSGGHTHPGGKGRVEMRDEHSRHVAPDPLVEHGGQEVPPGTRGLADRQSVIGTPARDQGFSRPVSTPCTGVWLVEMAGSPPWLGHGIVAVRLATVMSSE